MPPGAVADHHGMRAWLDCVLISFRCSFIASVLAAGMITAAANPRAGQIAQATLNVESQTLERGIKELLAMD